MSTILFIILVVFSLQHSSESHLTPVDDVCTEFPSSVATISSTYFKGITEIAIFPMYVDWFSCIMNLHPWNQTFSYRIFDAIENYNEEWHLNIDGVLLLAIRKITASNSDNYIEHRNFESIGMMITFGNFDRSIGSIRSATKYVPNMITLIVDRINGSKLCSFDRDYKMDCVNITEIDKIDRLADNNPENDKQVNGYFRVAMFNDPSNQLLIDNDKDEAMRAQYMDDEMLQIMARMLNFTPIYLNNSNDYGYQLSNGTLVGTLGDIEYERADLANSRVISDLAGANNVEFLFPLTFVRFKFVVPKNYYRNPKREINVAVLPPEFVPFYLSVIFWFPVGCKMIEHYNVKFLPSSPGAKISWISAITSTFAAMTNRSIKIVEISSQRVYWISLIWFQLIVYSVLQGRMVEEVSSVKFSRDIETIDDLMKTPLKLLLDTSMINYFNFSESAFKKYNLTDRIMLVEKQAEELMSMVVKHRSIAVLLPERVIRRLLPQYYDPKSGVDLLHVVPESTYEFYVAMYVPATSRFIEPLNQITMRCVEGGIVSFRMSYTLYSANLIYLRRRRMGKFKVYDESVAMIEWSTIEPFLISSVLMFLLACITLGFEILIKQMYDRKSRKMMLRKAPFQEKL